MRAPIPLGIASVGLLAVCIAAAPSQAEDSRIAISFGEDRVGLDIANARGFLINGLKREQLIAMNSMVLHELFMRILALVLLVGVAIWSVPRTAIAADSCKACADQRRTCMSNYSGKTCQTEYDRCTKDCKK